VIEDGRRLKEECTVIGFRQVTGGGWRMKSGFEDEA
jgi:hypothetical protein